MHKSDLAKPYFCPCCDQPSAVEVLTLDWLGDLSRLAARYGAGGPLADLGVMRLPELWGAYLWLMKREDGSNGN